MTDYSDLLQITAVLQERALDRHRRNLAQSRSLAEELTQIDALRETAQADQSGVGVRQILGADGLWQGWLIAKRSELLHKMTIAKAREADSLAAARLAFAKRQATQDLQDGEQREARRQRRLTEADNQDDLAVLRHFLYVPGVPGRPFR